MTAVGDQIVDRSPTDLREQAIESVGQRDKPQLVMGVLIVPVLLGALLASPRGARGLHLFVVGTAVLSVVGGAAATQSLASSASGRHVLRVRATDGTGALQPQGERQPFPSGASGWHTVAVTVTQG